MVLVVNCGSSSLKYQLFTMAGETVLASGLAERVGVNGGSQAVLKHRGNGDTVEIAAEMPDHTVALSYVLKALTDEKHGVMKSLDQIHAVGHRVVHGGEKFAESVVIDDEVMAAIEAMCALAPLHNPANLQGIRACQKQLPKVPQIAVFDTAFHQTMPRHAFLYGLPYELYEKHGLRRYGFHGTSHRYVSLVATEMLKDRGIKPAQQKFVTCHLGNGCSMAAVKGGRCVDTTMGLTPLEGLLMGTRCGDLDPAVPLHLQSALNLSLKETDNLLNKKSGLLGISGISNDMRDVQSQKDTNDRAKAAVNVFCYRVRKYIGAYAAAMGGVDAVIFTAGIGENDPPLRTECVAGLECLGLEIDETKNNQPKPDAVGWDVSTEDCRGCIFVIPTNEERMIARDTVALINGKK